MKGRVGGTTTRRTHTRKLKNGGTTVVKRHFMRYWKSHSSRQKKKQKNIRLRNTYESWLRLRGFESEKWGNVILSEITSVKVKRIVKEKVKPPKRKPIKRKVIRVRVRRIRRPLRTFRFKGVRLTGVEQNALIQYARRRGVKDVDFYALVDPTLSYRENLEILQRHVSPTLKQARYMI